jgi:hypothetical protein
MALPQEFEVYGATAAPGGRRTTKSMRIALVSGAVVLTMLAAVAFLAKDTEESNRAIEDYVVSPEDRLSSMVTDMALHANTMSLKDMEDRLEEWRNDPNTILGLPQPARTQARTWYGRKFWLEMIIWLILWFQMLADVGSSMMVHTSTLADDSTLCAKKDRIINLFDQLLKKLGGEVFYGCVIYFLLHTYL